MKKKHRIIITYPGLYIYSVFPMYFVRLQCSCCPFDLRLLFHFYFSSRSNRLRTQHISCSLLLLTLLLLRPPIERRTGTSQGLVPRSFFPALVLLHFLLPAYPPNSVSSPTDITPYRNFPRSGASVLLPGARSPLLPTSNLSAQLRLFTDGHNAVCICI